jgi:SAM-dependent methyltransferase
MAAAPEFDYGTVTEVPGNLVSREAQDMAWSRYAFAGPFCTGKSVLEVACGPGPGLGHLHAHARRVVGGDYTAAHLDCARAHYGARIPLLRLDAHRLPFRPASFDVVILFEAIYFLGRPDLFVESCRDVLKADGVLIIGSVSPDVPGFNPAPFSTRYPTGGELKGLMVAHGFSVDLYGGFPAAADGLKGRMLGLAKRAAVKLHMIPRTMKGKEWLKRLAFGRLEPFPREVSETTGTYNRPAPVVDIDAIGAFKVLYAVGRKQPRGGSLS